MQVFTSALPLQLSKLKEKRNQQELLNTSLYYFQSKSPQIIKDYTGKATPQICLVLKFFPLSLSAAVHSVKMRKWTRQTSHLNHQSNYYFLWVVVTTCITSTVLISSKTTRETLFSCFCSTNLGLEQLYRKTYSQSKTKIPMKSKANWNVLWWRKTKSQTWKTEQSVSIAWGKHPQKSFAKEEASRKQKYTEQIDCWWVFHIINKCNE